MLQIRHLDESIHTILQSQINLKSLSDVIRELTQNGVDANANNIKIEIKINYRDKSIELVYTDNGHGMDPESLAKFGKRFYTSKLNLNSENNNIGDQDEKNKLNILKNTKTFGFRGEAMNSLRTVCNTMIVVSRVENYNNGFQICFAGNSTIGNVIKSKSIIPVGTNIRILGLFDPIPIRRNIMLDILEKSWIEDTCQIRRCVIDSLISRPLIRVNIVKQELKNGRCIRKDLVSTSKLGVEQVPFQNQMKMLNNVFGGRLCDDYEICKVQFKNFQLKAGIGINTVQSKKYQFIYLNNRPFHNEDFNRFINQLFQKHYELWGDNVKNLKVNKESNMYGRPYSVNPIFIASFTTPIEISELIQDPSKVCFTSENYKVLQSLFEKVIDVYFGIFKRRRRDATGLTLKNVEDNKPQPRKRKVKESVMLKSKIRISKFKDSEMNGRICIEKDAEDNLPNKVFDFERIQEGLINHKEEEDDDVDNSDNTECEECNHNVPLSQEEIKSQSEFFSKQCELHITREDICNFEVIGQVENKFILVKFEDKIIGLDQHASDERTKLEKVYKDLVTNCVKGEFNQLEEAIELEFKEEEAELIKKYEESLKFWGIKMEDFHDNDKYFTKKLTHLPQLIFRKVSKVEVGLLCKGIVEYVENLEDKRKQEFKADDKIIPKDVFWWTRFLGHLPALYTETAKSRACRSAVMFGQALSREEQVSMVAALQQCYHPFYCAHGRPSLYPLCVVK